MSKNNVIQFIINTESSVETLSYEAYNENPRVFCSHGPNPSAALKAMAKILKKEDICYWTASSVNFDDDGICYLTIYA
jgi:hypothetical protein